MFLCHLTAYRQYIAMIINTKRILLSQFHQAQSCAMAEATAHVLQSYKLNINAYFAKGLGRFKLLGRFRIKSATMFSISNNVYSFGLQI